MQQNLVFTENEDYINSFKSIDNKISLKDLFCKDLTNQQEELALRIVEIKNFLREIFYKLIFYTDEMKLKETLLNITNELNIWILLKFIYEKYKNYINENTIKLEIIGRYNTLFEDLIDRIMVLKLEGKISDHELEPMSEFLDDEFFSKLFFHKLYQIIVEDDKNIEYKINHIFGGFFKILNIKFSEHKLEKIFYNSFIQKFFEKYDVLERALINFSQFINKKDKREANQSDSNYLNTKNIQNLNVIENVKIQIENILKYIYHESEKNNISYISNCLTRFCNENRIVLIEEKSRRSLQSNYNNLNKRESSTKNSIDFIEYPKSEEENLNLEEDMNENIKIKLEDFNYESKVKNNETDDELTDNNLKIGNFKIINNNSLLKTKESSIKNKNNVEIYSDNLLKNKRLRRNIKLIESKHYEVKDKKDIDLIKIEKNNKKSLINNKLEEKNHIKKRLNFEEINEKSDGEGIKNDLVNKKIKTSDISLKKISTRRNTKDVDLKDLENMMTSKKSISKEITSNFDMIKKSPNLSIKKRFGSNNVTPIKNHKVDTIKLINKNNKEKTNESHIRNLRKKKQMKENYFNKIVDSISLRKSRSVSSSSESRSSSINSSEKFDNYCQKQTRYSPRLETKISNQKNKQIILKKTTTKLTKSSNRELKSLEKIDFDTKSLKFETPEKTKITSKNSSLSANTRELRSSSKKESEKKKNKEKIKFLSSIFVKEFDPKTTVKSLSFHLKNSPKLKNNLLNKKSNLKKLNFNNDKIGNFENKSILKKSPMKTKKKL